MQLSFWHLIVLVVLLLAAYWAGRTYPGALSFIPVVGS